MGAPLTEEDRLALRPPGPPRKAKRIDKRNEGHAARRARRKRSRHRQTRKLRADIGVGYERLQKTALLLAQGKLPLKRV